MSAFALEGGVVHHTYSAYARGTDVLWGMWQWLDRAPKGRNETGRWLRLHNEYEDGPGATGWYPRSHSPLLTDRTSRQVRPARLSEPLSVTSLEALPCHAVEGVVSGPSPAGGPRDPRAWPCRSDGLLEALGRCSRNAADAWPRYLFARPRVVTLPVPRPACPYGRSPTPKTARSPGRWPLGHALRLERASFLAGASPVTTGVGVAGRRRPAALPA